MTLKTIRNRLDGGRGWTQLNDTEFDTVIEHIRGDFKELEHYVWI